MRLDLSTLTLRSAMRISARATLTKRCRNWNKVCTSLARRQSRFWSLSFLPPLDWRMHSLVGRSRVYNSLRLAFMEQPGWGTEALSLGWNAGLLRGTAWLSKELMPSQPRRGSSRPHVKRDDAAARRTSFTFSATWHLLRQSTLRERATTLQPSALPLNSGCAR